jgi:hypothetical protein
VQSVRLLKRLTLVIRDGGVEHVFYPVFPPDKNAEQVTALRAGRLMMRQMSADRKSGQRRFIRWLGDRDERLAAGATDVTRERQKLKQHPRVA